MIPVCERCGSGELVTHHDGHYTCWNRVNCDARLAEKAGTP